MGFFSKLGNGLKNTGKAFTGYDQIKDSAGYIKDMGKKILSPKYQLEKARVETFEEALKRHGVTYEDVKVNHRNFVLNTYISLFFAVVCFVLALNYGFTGQLMATLAAISILSLCLANATKHAFRAFQIKYKILCSFKTFMDSGIENWFPWFLPAEQEVYTVKRK